MVAFDDLLTSETIGLDVSAAGCMASLAGQVICTFDAGEVAMTPALWQRCVAKSQALGRPLDHADVLLLVGADDREDRDA